MRVIMPYAFTAALAFKARLAYRSEIWAGVTGFSALSLSKVAVWAAIYATSSQVIDGIPLSAMNAYALLAGAMLAAWDWSDFLETTGRVLKSGDITSYLVKPVNYLWFQFANELGRAAFGHLLVVIPSVLLVIAFVPVAPPASGAHAAAALVLYLNAFVVLFLLAGILGICAFWLMTTFSLEWLLGALLQLLSGAMVPFWFFPGNIGNFVSWLPFAFVAYHPMSAYLGVTSQSQLPLVLVMALSWSAILAAALIVLWRRAVHALQIQGG